MRFLLILAVLVSFGCLERQKPDIPLTWLPDPTLSKDVRSLSGDSVVFVGDSLTHIGTWRQWYPSVETSNQGWGGDRAINVLARLDPIIAAKPKKIFLLIGGNDICAGTPGPLVTELHRKIISRIVRETPKTKLYVQLVMPFGSKVRYYFGDKCPAGYKESIKSVNEALKLICKMYNVKCLDTYSLMAGRDNHFKPEYTIDQLHLSKIGYEVWVEFLRPYVEWF